MSTERDILSDRQTTARLILAPISRRGAADAEPNWLGHTGGAADIDRDLLDGATMAQLLRHRKTANNHLSHLAKEHGLVVERGDLVRFSRTDLGIPDRPSAAPTPTPRGDGYSDGRPALDRERPTGEATGGRPVTMTDAFDRAGAELQPLYPDGIPAAALRRRAHELTGHKPESLLPADFCYNRTNRGIQPPPANNPVFLWLREGHYRYVGRGHAYDGPVEGTPKPGPSGGRFITSRGYALPATPDGMAASPWFNLWQKRLWPYHELRAGHTLYWYDATRQAVVWESMVSRAEAFRYESKDALRRRLGEFFGDPNVSHPYLDRAADQGYCVAFNVDQVRPLMVPKPDGHRFPQEGWLRLDDENAQSWLGRPRPDPDGRAALDLHRAATVAVESGYFSPGTLKDERERRLREVVQRRGQPAFRSNLIAAYGGKCAVTGCDAVAALEAAHIVPYTGPDSDHVTNGLLLRADIHTLFDLDLIGINPRTLTVCLSAVVQNTSYADLDGRVLKLPENPADHPSRGALTLRWERFLGS